MNDFYQRYLRTSHWQRVRQSALDAARHRCHMCAEQDEPLDVHHKTYERLGHEQPEDVVVLCRHCHEHVHTIPSWMAEIALKRKPALTPDERGAEEAAEQEAERWRAHVAAYEAQQEREHEKLRALADATPIGQRQDEPDDDDPPDYHWLLFSERRHRTPNGRHQRAGQPHASDPMYNL